MARVVGRHLCWLVVCHCYGFEFEAEGGSNEGSSQRRKEIEVRLVKHAIGCFLGRRCVPRAISPKISVDKAQHKVGRKPLVKARIIIL